MQNYEITETQLNASSTHPNWRLNNGRLNYEHITKAGWLTTGTKPKWMQVDLILIATIVEIRTQGSPNHASTFWCIKTYTVKYGYESEFLQDYRVGGVTKVWFDTVTNRGIERRVEVAASFVHRDNAVTL